MKKHYFIYLVLLFLTATSCENTIFEKEISVVQSTTRSIPADFRYHNTYFQEIKTIDNGYGTEQMYGTIYTYPTNVEYDFTLVGKLSGDVKCKITATSGEIIYNGQPHSTYIYAIPGQAVRFTFKFHSPKTQICLLIERGSAPTYIEAEARLVVDRVRYNGEQVNSELDGYQDLTLRMKDTSSGTETSPNHWSCKNCGFLNSKINTTCISCGTNYK